MKTVTEDRDGILLDFIVGEAPVFLLRVDPRGNILEASRYAASLTGRDLAGSPIGSVFLDFTTPEDVLTAGAGEKGTIRLNVNTKSGLPQSLLFRFIALPGETLILGRPDAMELEDMRRQLVALNNELSALTRSLHKSNAQLARLNALKNQFLGMAAHDLRRPVGVILSYAEFLSEEAGSRLDGEQAGFLDKILAAADSMKAIINDFLDVAVIESGKLSVDLSSVSLAELIEAVLPTARLQARTKNVEIEAEIEPSLDSVPVDRLKMEQVLGNLLSNAVEYTGRGTKVRLAARRNEDRLLFSVRDQGPGIPADLREHLFQPFRKGTIRKSSGEKSTGLGLAVSRMIVEAHGGRIWVESEPGSGAEFLFSLPLTTALKNP
ncbi:MAG: PAS domain-containing sensor histidine kinase [Candidatus Aminicenantes bacterium]|nr:PAS domain-containing sensor histidine kinase [Candidatus Aminicenantes bacterium]